MNVEQALSTLKKNGYKYTGKREEMVRVFAREKRYVSAKDMLEFMKFDYPNISFDTIYRNLSLFSDLEIIESTELNGERIYRLACETEQHHHHLICTLCGRTKKLDMCPMNAVIGEPTGFTITGHKFEIYGYCETCEVQA
ncbi:Fur family transcriptional regulator [Bacillus horti]|uniref:Fur family zinc uptake transcriptional regulator n=1 Tax=Caldalkalibacillus horti TaxID=77523 RepID=A0ABT9W5I9_9BACI|nr:Fur family transcriptional regulator [Bacillus horti]MDQ0168105.1 Fur family zinc uptake transcriptional regulator [Bacillus horti]